MMVSPELLRRFPFFAGLSMDQMVLLAKAADEITTEAEHYLLREGDELNSMYIVREGEVATVVELIEKGKPAVIAELTEKAREVIVSTVRQGEVFGWSALIPPHTATAAVKTLTPCHLVAIDCLQLRDWFATDYRFAYLMMERAAQGMRDRLRDMRIETLAYLADNEAKA